MKTRKPSTPKKYWKGQNRKILDVNNANGCYVLDVDGVREEVPFSEFLSPPAPMPGMKSSKRRGQPPR
jgi:hypothetical protein